ncbi:gallate dioxygenase [Lonepinella sp. BR2474]|uniref:gallate dioxygenase n=1 Tax=Lonepinella sp. BR2474 TaxID=3434548 RepID=UPI003F6DDF39
MAKIIGGVGVSHSPTIGFAYDAKKQNDPAWKPIFEGFEPVKSWFNEKKPDVLIYIFNDHITSFFFDHYSAFALGIDSEYSTADEGGGARKLPPISGDLKFSQHIATSLMTDEFDMSFFQNKPLDHGFFSPMSVLLERKDEQWPCSIVPLQVGVLQFPIPTAKRCYKLGQAIKRAVESYPEDINVAIVSTGGLSHQVHGERCGFNNVEWDHEFLQRLADDPEGLAEITHKEYAELSGMEGAEIIMWLVMRGALENKVKTVHSSYYLPSMTAISTIVLESTENSPIDVKQHLTRMEHQLKDVETIQGTYPFTVALSQDRFRINKYLHDLVIPEHRELFLNDPELSFTQAGLNEQEKTLMRNLDWRGLIHYGAIFFGLEKLGAVVGVSNLHIYAAMRGESLEDFMKTRNTQVSYSVSSNTNSIDKESLNEDSIRELIESDQ